VPLATRPVHNSELLQQYERIFINVEKWGAFSLHDIRLNDIQEAQSIPDFIEKFERKLISKPNLDPGVRSLLNTFLKWPEDAYFEDLTTEDESHGNREQPWRSARKIEVSHIVDLAGINWTCFWNGRFGKALKGHPADGIFFYKFLANVDSLLGDNDKMPTAQLCVLSCLPPPIAI